jgi:hypothetical protein
MSPFQLLELVLEPAQRFFIEKNRMTPLPELYATSSALFQFINEASHRNFPAPSLIIPPLILNILDGHLCPLAWLVLA